METTSITGAKIVGVDIFGPATQDVSRLAAFYRDILGMTPTELGEGGAEFPLADGSTFGMWKPEQPRSGAGYSALFAVGDINAAVARFREQGAELGDPFETPVCFISAGKDPDGNEFYIHQRKTSD
jgi:predicted enzyme related to lactoylglutathione lyase